MDREIKSNLSATSPGHSRRPATAVMMTYGRDTGPPPGSSELTLQLATRKRTDAGRAEATQMNRYKFNGRRLARGCLSARVRVCVYKRVMLQHEQRSSSCKRRQPNETAGQEKRICPSSSEQAIRGPYVVVPYFCMDILVHIGGSVGGHCWARPS